jgi:hypothetical protein
LAGSRVLTRSNTAALARRNCRTLTLLGARKRKLPGVRVCRKVYSAAARLVAHKALQTACRLAFLESGLRSKAQYSRQHTAPDTALQLRPKRAGDPQHVGKHTRRRDFRACTWAAHDQCAVPRGLKLHDIVGQRHVRKCMRVGQALQGHR